MSDSERRHAQGQRWQGRGPSWPDEDYEFARLKAQHAARLRFDAELVSDLGAPVLSSLVDAEPMPEPTILRMPDGSYLLRHGWVHLFHGKPGSGKSPLTYLAVVEAVRAGGSVLLIDYEMGPSAAKALLMELGLTEALIQDRVLYAYNPAKWTQSQRDRLAVEVAERRPVLVVIDSLSRSMATAGLNQNDATETDAWFHSLPTWAVDQFGSAVLIIDHTNRADGPHPSGSIQKTAAPQFHVWVQNLKAFSRDHEDGCSLLVVQKDRSGQRPVSRPVAELRTEMGGSFVLREVGTVLGIGDSIEIDPDAMTYAQKVRIEVLDLLRSTGVEGITKTKVTGNGGADAKVRRDALDWLESQGQATWRKEPGTSRGQRWWAADSFPGDRDD